jgi:peptide/nickel transport system substrate-binding protein/oligopeptide transport system substrate-binding protein
MGASNGVGRKMTRRAFFKGGIAAGALVALAACTNKGASTASSATTSAQTDAATASTDGELVYSLHDIACIDPYNGHEDQGDMVIQQLFDGLLDYDYKSEKLVSLAAKSWEKNAAATEFTFHLISGATFHNGEPVTAASFKRAWERICNPTTHGEASSIAYVLAHVKGFEEMQAKTATQLSGVEAVDDLTLRVTLTSSYAEFPYACSLPMLGPVPQAALDDPDGFYHKPVGNGPFQLENAWVEGQDLHLRRFEGYYRTKSLIGSVRLITGNETDADYQLFQAGQLDAASIPSSEVQNAIDSYGKSEDGYTASPGKQVLTGTENTVRSIDFNVNDPVLSDVNLRKAISLSIDRKTLCEKIYNGSLIPADNIVMPSINGYEQGAWPYSTYDKNAAVALLDKYYPTGSDGTRGIKLELIYSSLGISARDQEVSMIIDNLSAVGIQVSAKAMESTERYRLTDSGSFQMAVMGWTNDHPSVDNTLSPLFSSTSGDNPSQYANKAVDAALASARAISDDQSRIASLQAINKVIAEDCPCAPLLYGSLLQAWDKRVTNVYVRPDTRIDMSRVTLAP